MEEKDKYYQNQRKFYFGSYWANHNDQSFYRPNGFTTLPEETYRVFATEIDKDGKALDLGCGNGLMLQYLIMTCGHKLIPYGADFMELSIKQAQEIIHPQYAKNFVVTNVIDYSFKDGPFDFIFVPLHHIHSDDRKNYLNKIKKNCQKKGKIIFYEYADALQAEKEDWIGDYLELKNWELERKDYPGLSLGIWKNR